MNFASLRAGLLAAAVSLAGLAGCAAQATNPVAAPAHAEAGILVGSGGMTLYTFDKDAAGAGKSVCNGQCAINWPPLLAADSDRAAADWSIVTRDDGRKQWAYKGKPVYYWVKDQKPGDRTGDGVNNAWRVAKE